MDLLVDTFSWKKFDLLISQNLITREFLYSAANLYITHTVKDEIEHFGLYSCKIPSTTILSVKNSKLYQFAQDLGYDIADSEIFSNAGREPTLIVVSEDRPLLRLLQSKKIQAIQVIDLFYVFFKLNAISSNLLFQISKFCREKKNISERKHKKIISSR
ncbi:MAG: hypothetical protein ACTSRK_02290 [Promethearchaeota archaeon]